MWLALVVATLGQAKDDQLYRQMEEKLAKAKTIELAFEVRLEGAKSGKMKGTLAAMKGNKARMELTMDVGDKSHKMMMISDGTRSVAQEQGKIKNPEPPPKNMDQMIRAVIARSGIFLPIMLVHPVQEGQKPKEFDVEAELRVSDIKAGKKEKINGRDADVIEYKLALKATKEPVAVKLWIDSKTHLPVQRTIAGPEGIMVTESYTRLEVDGAVDAKKFELPK